MNDSKIQPKNDKKSRHEWSKHIWNILLKDIKNPELSATLDGILSSYEKNMITNRIMALALLKKGESYKKIGEELWLSPTTIRCLKRVLNNSSKEYLSYRANKNKKEAKNTKATKNNFDSSFVRRIDNFFDNFPQKTGPRWKFLK